MKLYNYECVRCGRWIDYPEYKNLQSHCRRCWGIVCAEASSDASMLEAWNDSCPICGAETKGIRWDSSRKKYVSTGYGCNCGTFFDSGTLSERIQKGL